MHVYACLCSILQYIQLAFGRQAYLASSFGRRVATSSPCPGGMIDPATKKRATTTTTQRAKKLNKMTDWWSSTCFMVHPSTGIQSWRVRQSEFFKWNDEKNNKHIIFLGAKPPDEVGHCWNDGPGLVAYVK